MNSANQTLDGIESIMAAAQSKSWQKEAFDWIKMQGVSTVLLFALVYGLYVQIPKSVELLQRGYERNAASLTADVDRMEKTVDKLLQWIDANRRNLEGLSKEIQKNRENIEALKANRAP